MKTNKHCTINTLNAIKTPSLFNFPFCYARHAVFLTSLILCNWVRNKIFSAIFVLICISGELLKLIQNSRSAVAANGQCSNKRRPADSKDGFPLIWEKHSINLPGPSYTLGFRVYQYKMLYSLGNSINSQIFLVE